MELNEVREEYFRSLAGIPKPPHIIPMGAAGREPLAEYKRPSKVRTWRDLPQRCFLGDLDQDSVRIEGLEWEAHYAHDHDETTWTHLRWEAGRLFITQSWKGVASVDSAGEPLASIVPTDDFRDLVKFPLYWSPWDEQIATTAANFNTLNVAAAPDEARLCFFPDGYNQYFLIPIPVAALRSAWKFQQSFESDARSTSVTSYAVLGSSYVHYLDGRCPDVRMDQTWIEVDTIQATGMPIIHSKLSPSWQTGSDGTRALTVLRSHYVLVVSTFLRDFDTVISRLQDFGLLTKRDSNRNRPFGAGPEYWPVLPSDQTMAYIIGAKGDVTLNVAAPDGSRQVVYLGFPPDINITAWIMNGLDPDDGLTRIAEAESFSSEWMPLHFEFLDKIWQDVVRRSQS